MAGDYYEILEISRNASSEEIRKAYKRLAIQWHPDKNLDKTAEAGKKFRAISEAYQILSDEKKRKEYDETLSKEPKKDEVDYSQINTEFDLQNLLANSTLIGVLDAKELKRYCEKIIEKKQKITMPSVISAVMGGSPEVARVILDAAIETKQQITGGVLEAALGVPGREAIIPVILKVIEKTKGKVLAGVFEYAIIKQSNVKTISEWLIKNKDQKSAMREGTIILAIDTLLKTGQQSNDIENFKAVLDVAAAKKPNISENVISYAIGKKLNPMAIVALLQMFIKLDKKPTSKETLHAVLKHPQTSELLSDILKIFDKNNSRLDQGELEDLFKDSFVKESEELQKLAIKIYERSNGPLTDTLANIAKNNGINVEQYNEKPILSLH